VDDICGSPDDFFLKCLLIRFFLIPAFHDHYLVFRLWNG
jgi:hypothetical protein